MASVLRRMHAALNAHDLDAFVALFDADYRSEQPAYPGRSFSGRDKVRENWENVYSGVPDFRAELLLAVTATDGAEVGEWRWWGTHRDGAPFEMRGVTVLGVENGVIAWGRLYMDPVDQTAAGIDDMVRETYRPPDQAG